jgi:hypothetical protein
MLGIALVFAGFLVLGIFGSTFFRGTVEAEEFDDCYEYFEDRPPVPIDCEVKMQDKVLFFGLVLGLIAVGILALVKGARGRWDQDVKPQDMLGPGGERVKPSDDESDEKK